MGSNPATPTKEKKAWHEMPGLCFLAALKTCFHKLTGNRGQEAKPQPFSLISHPLYVITRSEASSNPATPTKEKNHFAAVEVFFRSKARQKLAFKSDQI